MRRHKSAHRTAVPRLTECAHNYVQCVRLNAARAAR